MKKEYLIKNLITLIYADQQLDPGEKNLMRRVCQIVGLDNATLNLWINEVRQKKVSIKVPSGLADRWLFFDVMVAACKADGIIQREERLILEHVAGRFGITSENLDARIEGVEIQAVMEQLAKHVEDEKDESS